MPKETVIAFLLAILVVLVLAPVLLQAGVEQFQAHCQEGDAHPVVCRVAETGGLFAEPTPATSAGADAP